ncbi:hypothetical protein KPB2_5575 [Klebsiella pneumoniae Kb677]|nr:hypothetical protein KPB2_5575 [Klebsiella pneumoniae Kb677]
MQPVQVGRKRWRDRPWLLPHVEQLLVLVERDHEPVEEVVEDVREELERRYKPRPVVPQLQLKVVREQRVPEPVKWAVVRDAVGKLLPPERVWAERLVVAQQEERGPVVELPPKLEDARRLVAQLERQRAVEPVQRAHEQLKTAQPAAESRR